MLKFQADQSITACIIFKLLRYCHTATSLLRMTLLTVDYYFLFYIQHEDASVNMFDHMVKVNNLLPSFTEYNLTEKDVIFIKELIAGTALDTNSTQVSLY